MSVLPVLITFFNRPANLDALLMAISKQENLELYFASDGPRNESDKAAIEHGWKLVEKYYGTIKFEKTLNRTTNLGCKLAMKGNIDWFFDQVEYGVILEDDCIPNDEFFAIMLKSLVTYKDNPDILCISGSDYLPQDVSPKDYTFRDSVFPMVWGWGCWSHKWKLYQVEIPDSRFIVEKAAKKLFGRQKPVMKYIFKNVFNMRFNEVDKGIIDTWDYSLVATCWRHDLRVLQLNGNSILNSGFGLNATHTKNSPPTWVPKTYSLNFSKVLGNSKYDPTYDIWMVQNVFNCTFLEVIKNTIKRVVR